MKLKDIDGKEGVLLGPLTLHFLITQESIRQTPPPPPIAQAGINCWVVPPKREKRLPGQQKSLHEMLPLNRHGMMLH